MELVAALAIFYLGYSVVRLSPVATLFQSRRGEDRWARGERLVLTSLWPGRTDVISERIVAGKWLTPARMADPCCADPEEPVPDVAVNGRSLQVDGRPALKLSTTAAARRLDSLLDTGDAGTVEERTRMLAAELERSLSLPEAARRIEDALTQSGYLGVSSSVYCAVVFVIVPLLSLRWHASGIWLLFLPVVGLLHLDSTIEIWRLHGRLLEDSVEERLSEVLTAFLFPPALLRARHDIVQAALCGVHPVAIAAVMLEEEPLRQYLAGELAHLDGLRRERRSTLLEVERRGVLEIARALGWSEADLRSPRRRRDPEAASYCPHCDAEFVAVRDGCPSCRSRILAYSGAASA